MSLHRSLKAKDALKRERNVFTRFERMLALQKDKRWSEGDSVFGLPKVRTRLKVRKKKAEKEEKKDEE
jgi:small basic protein (TIGR04137 family)